MEELIKSLVAVVDAGFDVVDNYKMVLLDGEDTEGRKIYIVKKEQPNLGNGVMQRVEMKDYLTAEEAVRAFLGV